MATKKKAAKKAAKKVVRKPAIKSAKKITPGKRAPVKKKAARRKSLAGADNSLQVAVEFRLGVGQITVTQFRKRIQIDEQTVPGTGNMSFKDVVSKDVLSINGACSGKASLSTNRSTTPSSSAMAPRLYPEGNIFDSLIIN